MNFVKKDPRIIILSGKACSGKNVVAKIIGDYYDSIGVKSIAISYASPLKEYAKNILGWDGSEESKPRDFLQDVGVDLIKKQIDDKFLINRVKEDICVYSYFYDVIIITDARFVEEISEIKSVYSNVVVFSVVRGNNNLTDKQKKHITEVALDDYANYDYVIYNDDYSDLVLSVRKILEVMV